ncbi:MAG: hypothetical protein ACKOKF_07060, partial [Bacteroidota bacterium]
MLLFCPFNVIAQAPSNDNPCSATPLTVGSVCNYTSFSNVNATGSTGVPAPGCGNYQGGDVWFSVVVPAGGTVLLNSQIGTLTNGAMAVYSGSCTNLTLISCSDNANGTNMPALNVTGQTPGATLFVRFWGNANATGAFGICASTPATNDEPCFSTPLPVNSGNCIYSQGSNLGATYSAGVAAPSCGSINGGQDVWFSAVVPASGSIVIQTQSGTMSDGAMAVYSGTSCSALNQVACNDDLSLLNTMPGLTVNNLTPGSTVYIRFWSYNNANNGTFTICIRENIPAAPTNQDCPNAIPICSNTWTTQQSFSGTGNILNEITPAISCLGLGERNDVWFTFTVQQSGNLNFNITPNNMSDDYDWAVYNLTNASCANIATTPGLQVSCNYSATPGNTGPTGATNSNSQGAAGNPFNQVIPVTAGQTYVVNVSNFSATADGFLIDFGASSAVIFDNIPPQLTSLASATVCGTSQLSFTFSENILCSTIQAGDFAITGPGGPYTVTGWSAAGCANGGTYTRNVTVTLSPPIRTPGTFQFYITNSSSSVTDLCQNVAPQDTLSFTINPITAVTSTVNATCNSANGAASVNPTSGTNPYSYSWSPTGGNGALASNLSPGNYTVTVTDADGCTTTQTAIVGNSNNGINASAVVTSVSCVGQNNGSISVTAIGAGPFNYIWNPNVGTGPTVSNLSPGSYSVVIADINGCSTTASYTVNPATPLTSAATTTNVRCYNGTTGSATVTPSGGTGPYTYSWSPSGGNGATANNLSAGSYSVTVTDNRGCNTVNTVNINQPPQLIATLQNSVNPLCFGAANGSASITVSGGTTPIASYSWSPSGAVGASATGLSAGANTVTVTDANGCTTNLTVNLANPPQVTATIGSPIQPSCNGAQDGSASVTPGGGSGNGYTYQWTPQGGTGSTANNLGSGNYAVTVTDSRGCTATALVAINQPTPVTATFNSVQVGCNGGSNGSISSNASGGTGPYSYNWLPTGGNASTASNLTAGNYTVTITDSRGCTFTRTTTITQPNPITYSISSTPATCGLSDGTAALSNVSGGVGPYTYQWSPSGGSGQSASALPSGAYTVTITDNNGCSEQVAIGVSNTSAPVASIISSTNISCANGSNGSATVSVSSGIAPYTYSWSPSGGNAATASGLPAGAYTVTVQDVNGCNTTATINLSEPAQVTAAISSSSNLLCAGQNNGSATALAGGGTPGYSYSWSPGGGTGATRNNLTAGSYVVTVTDQLGCVASATAIITAPTPLTTLITANQILCNGSNNGSAQVFASGGNSPYTFNWSPSGGNGATASGLGPGSYTVTITDDNGCTTNASTSITQPSPLVINTSATNINCNGSANGSITATVSGGTNGIGYAWTPSGGNSSSATGLAPGSYTVTATDANGCTVSATSTITQPSPLSLIVTGLTPVACAGGNTGSATVSGTGGTGNLSFSWSPGSSSGATASNLSAGNYTVILTDANGCTESISAVITQPNPLTASIGTITNVSCSGGNDGSASISGLTGGTPGFSISWSPTGGTDTLATALSAGNYTVTVTDGNGCTLTRTTTIAQPSPITLSTTVVNATCGLANGSANVLSSGGTPGYTYSWNPIGGNTANASGLLDGSYTVTTTDLNGCTQQATVFVNNSLPPIPTATVLSNVSCSGGSNGSASVNITQGTNPVAISWFPTGGTANSASNLTAGSYDITVTDALGCTAVTNLIISEPAPLSLSTNISDLLCNGNPTGSITVTPSGGTSSYSTIWTPGNVIGTTISSLSAGSYTAIVTDANGCTTSTTAVVNQPVALTVSTTPIPVSCAGGANGSITAVSTGGTGNITYNWTPAGGTTNSLSGLPAGSYSVTITDANGCTLSSTSTVTQPTPIIITTPVSTNVSCNGGSNGSISTTVSGGTSGYTYNWSSGSGTGSSATGLTAGPYTLTVTDANGCTANTSATITEPALLVATIPLSSNVLCNGGSDGSATVSVAGGTSGFSFLWTPYGGSGTTANGLTAGNYSVTVTDANGCVTSSSTIITEPTQLTAAISSTTPVLCNGGSTGSATATVSGGTPGISISWTPIGGNGISANQLPAGNYTITVTDANGCTTSSNATISEPPSLTVTATSTPALCAGTSDGTLSATTGGGTPAYTYNWSNGGSTPAINGVAAGNYSVTITDANGCTISASTVISQPQPLTSTAATTANVSCFGGANGSAIVNAAGGTTGYLYNWTPSGGTSSTASGLSVGAYSVTITDANGCITVSTVTINQPNLLVASITSSSNVLCNGGNSGSASATVTGGTSGYTYSWTPSGGNGLNAGGLTAGSYSVTVTDANGCTSSSTVVITEPTLLTASSQTTSQVSCNNGTDGSITVNTTGGTPILTYAWTPSVSSVATATNLPSGNYSIIVTDANGCTTSTSATVTQPTPVIINTTSIDAICGNANGSLTASASGGTPGYSYNWNPGNTTGATLSGLAGGSFLLTVTDANGCISTSTASVIARPGPIATASTTANVSCNGGNNGSITAAVSNGTSPLSINWSPSGGNTATSNGLPAGTYTITVTDANGCISTSTTIITEPTPLISSASSNPVSCNGGSNGSVSVTTSGGTSPSQFLWTPGGNTTSAVNNLPAGTYQVTVTDANGCNTTSSTTITQPLPLSSTSTGTDASCNGGNDGTASAFVSGGTSGYTYSWFPTGGSTSIASSLSAGSYSVTVTDLNGCQTSTSVLVGEPAAISLLTTSNAAICGNSNGSASVSASGGTSPFVYSWTPGNASTATISGLLAGGYNVTVTDANGCISSASATVSNIGGPIAAASVTNNVSCNGGNNGTASVSVSSGTPPFSYTWSPSGGATFTASGLSAGNYTVNITDSYGCITSDNVTITQPTIVSVSASSNPVTCNGLLNGSASANANGGTGSFNYNWNPGNISGSTAIGLAGGNYTVTATDANGCTASASVIVQQPTQVNVTTTAQNVSCNGGTNGSATAVATGGNGGFSYSWFPTGGNGSIGTGLSAGNYTVTATDINGCTGTTSLVIQQPAAISLSVTTIDATCGSLNGSATVSASGGAGGYTYTWTSSSSTTNTANNLPGGAYTVTVTDANGCTRSAIATISNIGGPTITASVLNNVSCNGGANGSATVNIPNGTAPYNYSWAPSGGTGAVANGLPAGNYSITVTDANGCISSDNVTITQPVSLSIQTSSNPSTCFGGNGGSATVISAGGTAPYTYSWNNGGGSGSTANNLTAGNYTVTVTDANGCTRSSTATVSQPAAVTVNTTTIPATCNGASNGTATASPSGGTAGYTFSWFPAGGTGATAVGLSAGNYTITVTDANGCSQTSSTIISQPSALSLATSSNAASCGSPNGSASVSVTGGQSPYTYAWAPGGSTTSTANGLLAGAYNVTVTDANGCTNTSTASVSNTGGPTINASVTNNVSCFGGNNGRA